MPVVQTPIPGDQLANMDEQVRAAGSIAPVVPEIPQEMLQQAVAAAPEQELARLASAMNAPLPPEMPVIPMAQGGLPTVKMFSPGGNPGNPYGAPSYAYGLTGRADAMDYHPAINQGQRRMSLTDWNATYGPDAGGGGGGGGTVAASTPESTRGPVQTISLGAYTPPPADYQHGIDPQWDYYPSSATTTVDMNRGGMVQDAMRLQSAGSGDHNRLVHMTQDEVDAMNALAASGIGGLRANGMAINPETGLPEAGIFKDLLPSLVGLGLTFASGGTINPWLIGGITGATSMATTGGDLGRSILAGLGAGFGASLSQSTAAAGLGAEAGLIDPATGAASATQVGVTGGLPQPASPFLNMPTLQGATNAANVATPLNIGDVGISKAGADIVRRTSFSDPQAYADVASRQLLESVPQTTAGFATGRQAMQQGLGMWGTPAVPWSEVAMKSAPGALSLADAGGLFDPPKTDWGEDTGIEGYNYQGPYLPYPQTATAPPEGFQPGIDPQFQYFSYGNKGGYVGGLPTIRAQSGYEQINMPRNQQQQQGSQVFNQLAMMGAGLGGQQQAGATPLNQTLMQQKAQRRQPLPIYTASIAPDKIPMVRPQGMPQQTAMAAHGGPVGNLIDPQYRWSDTPDPMMREQVYRRANGGLAGIDPQYRWSDTANPATREHLYRPTVRMKEGTGMMGMGTVPQPDDIQRSKEKARSVWEQIKSVLAKRGGPTDNVNPAAAKAMMDRDFEQEAAEEKARSGLTIKRQAGGLAGIDPQYRWSDVPNPADREHLYRPTVRAEEGKRGDVEKGKQPPWWHGRPIMKGNRPFHELEKIRQAGINSEEDANRFRYLADVLRQEGKGLAAAAYLEWTVPKVLREWENKQKGYTFLTPDEFPEPTTLQSAPYLSGEEDKYPILTHVREAERDAASRRPGADIGEVLPKEKVEQQNRSPLFHGSLLDEVIRRIPSARGIDNVLSGNVPLGTAWEYFKNPDLEAEALGLNKRARGGVAGEPEISETGIMEVSTPGMKEIVAEREMVTPAPDQPQNPAERVVFDQAVLALQGELEPEPAQAAITEFIDYFGPEAFRQLQALVGGERENGGLVQTASGETTVGMSEEEVMAQQGPDVIPGKIVDPTTGQQTANLLVGENEYIEPADSLSRRAMAAGMAPTPQNGAMIRGQEEEQLRRAYG